MKQKIKTISAGRVNERAITGGAWVRTVPQIKIIKIIIFAFSSSRSVEVEVLEVEVVVEVVVVAVVVQ